MKVQFPTTVKYNGDYKAPHTPFEIDSEDLESLLKDGAIVVEADKEDEGDPLEKMTIAELKAFAAEKQIELGELTKKADILDFIKSAIEAE